MKQRLAVIVAAIFLALSTAPDTLAKSSSKPSKASPGGSHSVRGYVKKDGTYVAPHRARNPSKPAKKK